MLPPGGGHDSSVSHWVMWNNGAECFTPVQFKSELAVWSLCVALKEDCGLISYSVDGDH